MVSVFCISATTLLLNGYIKFDKSFSLMFSFRLCFNVSDKNYLCNMYLGFDNNKI